MSPDHVTEHEHELEAEYLTAIDASILEIVERDGSIVVDVVVPCPTCSAPLRASARVEEVTEADVELPLEDAEDTYD